MAHLIEKSALVAEIERRTDELWELLPDASKVENGSITTSEACNTGKYTALESFRRFINTLEVKEVNLEKEFYDFLDTLIGKDNGHLSEDELFRIAEYFFELGLSVNNPITAADRGTAEEIIINLKRVEQDYRIDLTKEMEWLRNKVKKKEGANWQKEQFEKNRLTACDAQTPEEAEREMNFASNIIEKEHRTPTYDDAIKYGMRLQKEQMMKDAINAEVAVPVYEGKDLKLTQLVTTNVKLNVGDKVKLIIIKD